MAPKKLVVLPFIVVAPFLAACSSTRPTTYAERLETVADDYGRDLARVERILEGVRPHVIASPTTNAEVALAAAFRRAEMALELARGAIERARLENRGDPMRRVAAYSLLALEYAHEAHAYAASSAAS